MEIVSVFLSVACDCGNFQCYSFTGSGSDWSFVRTQIARSNPSNLDFYDLFSYPKVVSQSFVLYLHPSLYLEQSDGCFYLPLPRTKSESFGLELILFIFDIFVLVIGTKMSVNEIINFKRNPEEDYYAILNCDENSTVSRTFFGVVFGLLFYKLC